MLVCDTCIDSVPRDQFSRDQLPRDQLIFIPRKRETVAVFMEFCFVPTREGGGILAISAKYFCTVHKCIGVAKIRCGSEVGLGLDGAYPVAHFLQYKGSTLSSTCMLEIFGRCIYSSNIIITMYCNTCMLCMVAIVRL